MEKVGLVLSGGSAYGFAHIGVLKVLVKNKIPIDIITGTSMGALIGGLYASGMSIEQMENEIVKFSNNKFMDFNLFGFSEGGFLHGKKIIKVLKGFIGEKEIKDCKIPFSSVATDLISGEKVVLDEGLVVDAIRASISIPGLFKPIIKDGKCLIDGGGVDNLPVDEARKLGATKVISVDVCSQYSPENKLKTPLDILISSANLMIGNLTKLKKDKGDVCISVSHENVRIEKFDYKNSAKAVKNGELAAKQALPEIKKLLGIN